MWGHAITVAVVGFSVVFAGLLMLTIGVKIMSFFCNLGKKHGKKADAAKAANAA